MSETTLGNQRPGAAAAGETTKPAASLRICDLSIEFRMATGTVRAVNGVSLEIRQGETVGVVGESGSGKSVTFLSVMGIIRPPGAMAGGNIELDGRRLTGLRQQELREIRGRDVAMVFQDPQTSLNPVFPVGQQIMDVIRAHDSISREAAKRRALEVLDQVGIPEAARRFGDYPHQFSGGMRQRVMIAMALALRPRFIIADEPTTALDVTMQAQILDLLRRLKREMNVGLVLITHDLGVVAQSADRVLVMYAGRIVEEGLVDDIFHHARHPYTRSLLRSMPRVDTSRASMLVPIGGAPPVLSNVPSGCAFHPRCFLSGGRAACHEAVPPLATTDTPHQRSACHFAAELAEAAPGLTPAAPGAAVQTRSRRAPPAEEILRVEDLKVHFPVGGLALPWKREQIKAVDGVSFSVRRGETIGLVGESGCGKSTLGRTLIRLVSPTAGRVHFRGTDITHLGPRAMRPLRNHLQMVFQDPYASLDPRMTVFAILQEPFVVRGIWNEKARARIFDLMARVGLDPEHADRRPHEFSGGQRQRIGVARALALDPELIVLDEPVSALDVSVQAQIINLLQDLQAELNLTYIFIAHDLSVVRHISDRVLVMYLGRIVEAAERDAFFAEPRHPYSRALLSAVPIPDPQKERGRARIVVQGGVPSPIRPPSGCHFHPRCARATELGAAGGGGLAVVEAAGRPVPRRCVEAYPVIEHSAEARGQACHFPEHGPVPGLGG